ncbi:MAG: hypothetical protein CVV60_06665, partial [Tenericutes bacterium HGW-Tenericutes-5]
MGRFKQLFKRNIYFTITLIVLLLSITFAGMTLAVFSFGKAVDQTSIGFIYLGNYEENEYAVIIENQIDLWKDYVDYRIQYQDYTLELDLDFLDLDINQTLDQITKDTDNQAYFTVSTSNYTMIEDEIKTYFTTGITTSFDMDAFMDRLLSDVSELKNRKVYELIEFLDDQVGLSVVQETQIDQIDALDVNQIIQEVQTIKIDAESRFSLLEKIGELNLTNEQLSIIASGIQVVSLNTNFNGFIFEKNYTLPSWASSGQNVRILRVNQFDFSFSNNSDMSYDVTIEKTNDTTLTFKLIGYPYITSYVTTSVFQVEIPFQTIYLTNDTIDELTPNVIITETDTEYIYQLLVQPGVLGQVSFYIRTETRPGQAGITTRLFD